MLDARCQQQAMTMIALRLSTINRRRPPPPPRRSSPPSPPSSSILLRFVRFFFFLLLLLSLVADGCRLAAVGRSDRLQAVVLACRSSPSSQQRSSSKIINGGAAAGRYRGQEGTAAILRRRRRRIGGGGAQPQSGPPPSGSAAILGAVDRGGAQNAPVQRQKEEKEEARASSSSSSVVGKLRSYNAESGPDGGSTSSSSSSETTTASSGGSTAANDSAAPPTETETLGSEEASGGDTASAESPTAVEKTTARAFVPNKGGDEKRPRRGGGGRRRGGAGGGGPFLRLNQLKNKALRGLQMTSSASSNNKRQQVLPAEGEGRPADGAGAAPQQVEDDRERQRQVRKVAVPTFLASAIFNGGSGRRGAGGDGGLISFPALFALSLLGSSVGFYRFLYFISFGYALGVTLPLAAAMAAAPRSGVTLGTKLHSSLVILWGIRSVAFFLWRESVSWPALHAKIKSVKSPPAATKSLFWVVYSFLYVCMMSPCWFRLEHDTATSRVLANNASSSSVGGVTETATAAQVRGGAIGSLVRTASRLGLLLQVFGLALESVADWQKCRFKASFDPLSGMSQRNQWCRVGAWRWSTHPNYLGELLFWAGTFLGGAPAMTTPLRFATMAAGVVFISLILRGAAMYLAGKHAEKYGYLDDFVEFRSTHGFFGPKSVKALLSHFPSAGIGTAVSTVVKEEGQLQPSAQPEEQSA